MDKATRSEMNRDFIKGETLGRKDGAKRWGALPASEFSSHAEYSGYEAGYRSTYCL